MKKFAGLVVGVSVSAVLILARYTWSQQSTDITQRRDVSASRYYPDPLVATVQQHQGLLADNAARSEIARLMNQLRDADSAKKPELTKQLEAAVDKYFDEDMKTREAELAKLEERLSKLRSQLDRRRKAKTDIIQLQIKVLLNEADGLGFTGASFFDGYVTGSGGAWLSDGQNTFRFQSVAPHGLPSPVEVKK
jgi:phosphoenolpyruvate-protein kinase (PTS system EI component)